MRSGFVTIIMLLIINISIKQVLCQNELSYETGLPFLKNFSPDEYDAHSQNFDIIQDSNGLMYFANFAGVLEYDGTEWELITTENISMVRSLDIDKKNRIFIGGMGEFGYLHRTSTGKVQYIPLNDSVKTPDGNVWKALCLENRTYFAGDSCIIYNAGNNWVSKTINDHILSVFSYKDRLILFLREQGMCYFDKNKIVRSEGGGFFSGNIKVVSVFEFSGKMLIVTSSNGIYSYTGDTVNKTFPLLNPGENNINITTARRLKNNEIALGTVSNGILIIDNKGTLVKKADQDDGLMNQYIHNLYVGTEDNLWAALNNGIALVNYPSPLSYFDQRTGLYGGVKDIIRFKNELYAATYQGLFQLEAANNKFRKINGINSACWSLETGDDMLLIATSEGVFSMRNKVPEKMSGKFTYSVMKDKYNSGYYYCGRNDGLYLTHFRGTDSYDCKKIPGTSGNVINMLEDSKKRIWFATISRGVYMYDLGKDSVYAFGTDHGLPSVIGNGISLVNNSILISTRNGLYKFLSDENKFFRTDLFNSDSLSIDQPWNALIVESPDGEVWTTGGDEKSLCAYKPSGNQYRKIQTPFLPIREKVIQNIFFDKTHVVYLGGPEGIICYNKSALSDYDLIPGIVINRIRCGRDSVIFENLMVSKNRNNTDENKVVVLNHSLNSVSFSFSLPFYHFADETQYQYFLEGYEETWSGWTFETFKEYTNLSNGSYVFHVRAKNIYDKISPESKFVFEVLPPWYSTLLAYILYLLILALLVFLIIRWRSRKLIKEKKVLEEKVADRTAEIVKQKEEIEIKSEELADKNLELEKINTVVKSINTEIHFSKLMTSLLENIIKIESVERATILLWDSKDEAYKYKSSVGWDLSKFRRIKLSLEQANNRYIKEGKEVFRDVFLKTKFTHLDGAKSLDDLQQPRSILVLIIRIEDEIDGFLLLENMNRENAFGKRELSFLKNLKEHIVSAFIKVNILEDLQATLENLKDTQSQLVQSEKLASLGQLTAGIAHEIQNPLNFVNNFSTLASEMADELMEIAKGVKDKLDEDIFDDILDLSETIKENVIKINEHGKRAESIVKGMLQHSRGKSGEFQLTDINKLVQEYVNLAYHGMRAKDKSFNAKFNTDYDPDAGSINCVPQDFSRAVLNIVNNACYAVSEKSKKLQDSYKPEIDISTKRKDYRVVIRIKDNGTGIPDKVIDKIFNPFFTTKPSGKGTGLGLSMTHDIITQLHKGHLEVESKAGEYTVFTITVPVNVEKINPNRKT